MELVVDPVVPKQWVPHVGFNPSFHACWGVYPYLSGASSRSLVAADVAVAPGYSGSLPSRTRPANDPEAPSDEILAFRLQRLAQSIVVQSFKRR
jgi:hypothetical protein